MMNVTCNLMWGLGTDHLPKFGARAILEGRNVSLLRDRCGTYGDPTDEWCSECDTVLPVFIQRLTAMYQREYDSSSDTMLRLEHNGWVCEANPRGSYGYLYLDIYKQEASDV